jgi:hypothetical protein
MWKSDGPDGNDSWKTSWQGKMLTAEDELIRVFFGQVYEFLPLQCAVTNHSAKLESSYSTLDCELQPRTTPGRYKNNIFE